MVHVCSQCTNYKQDSKVSNDMSLEDCLRFCSETPACLGVSVGRAGEIDEMLCWQSRMSSTAKDNLPLRDESLEPLHQLRATGSSYLQNLAVRIYEMSCMRSDMFVQLVASQALICPIGKSDYYSSFFVRDLCLFRPYSTKR